MAGRERGEQTSSLYAHRLDGAADRARLPARA